MRNVVLAFNFVSVFYAIISGLLILFLITFVTTELMDISTIPPLLFLLIFLLPANMYAVYGLKRRKTWAYVACSAQVIVWFGLLVYSLITEPFDIGTLINLCLPVTFAALLYNDYLSADKVDNEPQ